MMMQHRRIPVSLLSGSMAFGLLLLLVSRVAGAEEEPRSDSPAASSAAEQATADASGAEGGTVGTLGRADQEVEEIKKLSDDEWQEEFLQFKRLVNRFQEGVELFQKDVQTYIQQKYSDELKRIQQTYDARNKRLDEEVKVRREQAIAALERFIQKYPQSEHTPLAMFRLAELYYDESVEAFVRAQDEYDRMLSQLDSNAVEIPDAPKYDFSRSLALYERIQKEFPDFENIDGVYYMRGYLYGKDTAAQYDPKKAKDIWLALVTEHPESQFASQAYLRIGSYYFEEGSDKNLKTAIEYFQRVMSYQDNWYDQALYKMAWAYYNLSDYAEATVRFIELIDYSRTMLEETGKGSALRAEAVQYLAISFADSGTVQDALAFFDEIGDRPYKLEVLKRLAEVYVNMAKYEEAIETYSVLQELFPYNEENPSFQNSIVQILSTVPPVDVAKVNAAAEELVRRYGPDSDWWREQGKNRAATANAQKLAETRLRQLAFYYHDLANQADDPQVELENYTIAAQKYREYLQRFPYADQAYELQYFFAECLFFSRNYEEAAIQFKKAMAYTNPKYHTDAAKGVVDSYQELVAADGLEGVLLPFPEAEVTYTEDGVPRPIPISPLRKKYIQAIDVLARVSPDDDVTAKYLYIAALTNFYHFQFDEAQRRFDDFIARYPHNEFADDAAANLVDLLRQQKKWREMMVAIDRLAGMELGNDFRAWEQVREAFGPLKIAAHRKIAEELAASGDRAAAVPEFEQIGEDVDLFNAAQLLEEMGKVDRAIEDYKRLTELYPTSEHVEEALFRIASNYEKFFDLPQAIKYYELLARNYPDSAHAKDSIINAAFLRIGLHQYQEAARLYERYVAAYPKSPEAEPLLFLAGQNYLKAKNYPEAIRTFRRYLKQFFKVNGDRTMEAHIRIIESLEALGRRAEARDLERKTPNIVKSLEGVDTFTHLGLSFYGQIMFKDMQRTMDEFQRAKFVGNSRAMARTLDKKLELINTLEQKMVAILKIGDVEWYSAALYTVGLAYHTFADDLRDAVPSELSEEDRELYMQTLEEEFIYPFEDKAVLYYSKNLDLESAKQVWNKWIELTYEKLNLLRPDLYPARKKEQTKAVQEAQQTIAPPILELPMAGAGALLYVP